MEFCPQEIVVGNLADWAAVVVAAVVGVLVWRLTKAANKIAQEAHDARIKSDERETLQVALIVMREMVFAGDALTSAERWLARDLGETLYITEEHFRLKINALITGIPRSDVGESPQHLAKLPNNCGASVLIVWSHIETMLQRIRTSREDPTDRVLASTFHELAKIVPMALEASKNALAACEEAIREKNTHTPSTISK